MKRLGDVLQNCASPGEHIDFHSHPRDNLKLLAVLYQSALGISYSDHVVVLLVNFIFDRISTNLLNSTFETSVDGKFVGGKLESRFLPGTEKCYVGRTDFCLDEKSLIIRHDLNHGLPPWTTPPIVLM